LFALHFCFSISSTDTYLVQPALLLCSFSPVKTDCENIP
jgi:hypothetical protein